MTKFLIIVLNKVIFLGVLAEYLHKNYVKHCNTGSNKAVNNYYIKC